MSQLIKKFLADNAVDASKVALLNDTSLKARNAADSAYVDMLKLNTSDRIEFVSVPQTTTDAVAGNDLVRLSQIQSIVQGLNPKNAVRAATTTNITLSGPQTIDGVSVIAGDRVLVPNQTTATQNGIYVVAAGAWTRATDLDASTEFPGAYTLVREGTIGAGAGYVCNVANSFTLGVDNVTWIHFSSAGSLIAGNGISISGTTISVNLATNSGLEFSGAQLQVDADKGLQRSAAGLQVKVEAVNPSLDFFGAGTDELGLKIAATSALQKTASGVRVQLEAANPTLQIDGSNQLGIKVSATTSGLETSATGFQVNVDATNGTTKINGSNELEGLKKRNQIIALTGTDITNQYVDLSFAARAAAEIELCAVGGIPQRFGTDYTVSLTGGAGGVTRVTFAGDLATAGASALIATDILMVTYESLA